VDFNLLDNEQDFLERCIRTLKNTSPSLLSLTTPCGISGRNLSDYVVTEIVKVADKYGHLVLIDEAYLPYGTVSHSLLLSNYNNLIILRTFSKVLGMAGLRFAVLMANSSLYKCICSLNPSNGVSNLALDYFCKLTSSLDLIERVNDSVVVKKRTITECLSDSEKYIKIHNTDANFLLFEFLDENALRDFIKLLERNSFIVKPMRNIYSFEKCLRIAIPPDDLTNKFCDLLREFTQAKITSI